MKWENIYNGNWKTRKKNNPFVSFNQEGYMELHPEKPSVPHNKEGIWKNIEMEQQEKQQPVVMIYDLYVRIVITMEKMSGSKLTEEGFKDAIRIAKCINTEMEKAPN
jgi:hypothetical protein